MKESPSLSLYLYISIRLVDDVFAWCYGPLLIHDWINIRVRLGEFLEVLVWGMSLSVVAGLAWATASVTRLLSFGWTEAENTTLHFALASPGHLNPGQNSQIDPYLPGSPPFTSRALFPIIAQTKGYIKKLSQATAKRKAVRNIKGGKKSLLPGKTILYFSTSCLLVFRVEAFQIFPPEQREARAASSYSVYVQDCRRHANESVYKI